MFYYNIRLLIVSLMLLPSWCSFAAIDQSAQPSTPNIKDLIGSRVHLYSSDGNYALTGRDIRDKDTIVNFWNVKTGDLIRQLKDGRGAKEFYFSPDYKFAVITDLDNAEHLWNLETGEYK